LGTQNIIHLSVDIPAKVARPGGTSDLGNVCIIIVLGLKKRSGLSFEGEEVFRDLEGEYVLNKGRAVRRSALACPVLLGSKGTQKDPSVRFNT
jgi:hypothetical protein